MLYDKNEWMECAFFCANRESKEIQKDISEVIWYLQEVKKLSICYNSIGKMQWPDTELECSHLEKFFKVIKDNNEEAYENASGGFDIFNIKKFVESMNEPTQLFTVIAEFRLYLHYLTYWLVRAEKITDPKKAMIHFKGLILI